MKSHLARWVLAFSLFTSCMLQAGNRDDQEIKHFCQESEGMLLEYRSPQGIMESFCRYAPNGIVAVRTLSLEKNNKSTMAGNLFLSRRTHMNERGTFQNPGYSYCLEVGGKVQNYTDERGQMGVCTFEDGSQLSQWTLFRGADREEKLAQSILLLRGQD